PPATRTRSPACSGALSATTSARARAATFPAKRVPLHRVGGCSLRLLFLVYDRGGRLRSRIESIGMDGRPVGPLQQRTAWLPAHPLGSFDRPHDVPDVRPHSAASIKGISTTAEGGELGPGSVAGLASRAIDGELRRPEPWVRPGSGG